MASTIDFIIKIQDEVTPKIDALSKKVEGLEGKFDGAKKHAEGLNETLKEMGSFLIELFAIEKVIEWGKEAYDETVKLQKAQEGLAMAVENTAAKNGMTLDALKEQTEELRKHSDFNKADIVSAQARIALAGLSKEAQEKANKVALDYAAQQSLMGRETSPVEAAQKLERALVNVKGATRLLAEEGISLTTAQKKELQALVDTGQKAKAQEFILNSLASHTEGAAARMLAADPMGRLKLGMEEISEKAGPLIIRAFEKIEPLIEKLISGFSEFFDWIDKNSEAIGDYVDIIESELEPVWDVMLEIIDDVKDALSGLFDWIKENHGALREFAIIIGTTVAETLIIAWELIEHVGLALMGVYNSVKAVALALNGDFSAAWDAAGAAADDFWTKQGEVYDKTTQRIQDLEDKKNKKIAEGPAPKTTSNPDEKKGEKRTPKGTNDAVLGGASTAASSAKGPTQIFVNIGKFGETHIETKNFQEAPEKMHDAILQSLTRALNDAQNIATRPS